MSKYSSSDDIYQKLVEESDENWLYGLVAFAIIEEQRIEWAKHHKDNHGNNPTHEEIQNWYEQQPEGALLRAKGTAENALEIFSGEVVDAFAIDNKKEIEESIIVSEIRSIGRYWPQFGLNVAGGFISTLLFTALLVLFAFIIFNDISPTEIASSLKNKSEVIHNGQE